MVQAQSIFYFIYFSALQGNAKALSTVTAIIDGTGSIGW